MNIKAKLDKIHLELLDMITDPFVRDMVHRKGYIAGGAIVSLLLEDEPSDYDYYFTSVSSCNTALYHLMRKPDLIVKYSSLALKVKPDIHLIHKFTGKPHNTISRFDFEHCKCFYIPYTGKLHIKKGIGKLIQNRQLVYAKGYKPKINHYSVYRLMKFLQRGWHINDACLERVTKHMKGLNG